MQLQLQHYLNRFRPAPDSWFEGMTAEAGGVVLDPLPCESFEALREVWMKAMEWTDFLDIGLTSMLAVTASTPLQGDQFWLRAIAKPGTAKTTLCEAVLTNREFCKPLSITTGLHSGYKDQSGEDFSLIDRLNGRTAVWNEGDTLATSSNVDKMLGELRDVYSGFTHADYRNQKTKSYEGLRISIILAGTNRLREMNKSAVGDRFLDCIMYKSGSAVEESRLVRNVLKRNRLRRITISNGQPDSYDSPEKTEAKQRTAGYINWLRANVGTKLKDLFNTVPDKTWDRIEMDCEMMGRLVAYMRTRSGKGEEEPTEKELHIRLSEQLLKAAQCTAVVMNRTMDEEVMRRAAKLAHDTCYGITWDIAKTLQTVPLTVERLCHHNSTRGKSEELVRKSVTVLHELGAIKSNTSVSPSGVKNRTGLTYSLTQDTSVLINRLNTLLKGTTI